MMRNSRKLIIIIPFFSLAFSSCSTKNNEISKIEQSSQEETFERVLSGEIKFDSINGEKSIDEIEFNDEILYCLVDVDNDNRDELCLKGRTATYFIDSYEDNYKEIYEGTNYDIPLETEMYHGIYYYKQGAAPFSETFKFTQISVDSEVNELIYAAWYDGNENNKMDEDDLYFLESGLKTPVTKDEWLNTAGEYTVLKDINIDWVEYK